jgi:hypothetical protein
MTLLGRWRSSPDTLPSWEGKEISDVTGEGFVKICQRFAIDFSGIWTGELITKIKWDRAMHQLWTIDFFKSVNIRVTPDPKAPQKVHVCIAVIEK